MNALEIKDLSKSFGSFSLQNLTLTVPMGTAYVANKARSMALYICIYVQLAAALAAILIFKQTLVGQVLCALTCLQTLVYTGCFWYYNRKY